MNRSADVPPENLDTMGIVPALGASFREGDGADSEIDGRRRLLSEIEAKLGMYTLAELVEVMSRLTPPPVHPDLMPADVRVPHGPRPIGVTPMPRGTMRRSVRLRSRLDRLLDRYGQAGFFSWTVGLIGAAAFMATAVGPGWLGFLVAYLPASALAAWAVGHGG